MSSVIDVDLLHEGPARAISPRQGIYTRSRPGIAGITAGSTAILLRQAADGIFRCRAATCDIRPAERGASMRFSRRRLRERAQIHLIRRRSSADRIEIPETIRRTNLLLG